MKPENRKTAVIVCLFLGILALTVGITSLVKRDRYIPVEATITRIEEYYSTEEDQCTYNTIASYRVDGKEYENDIGYYEPSFEEGKTIEIRYNPADPSEVEAASAGFLIYLVIIGAVLIAAGVFLMIRRRG